MLSKNLLNEKKSLKNLSLPNSFNVFDLLDIYSIDKVNGYYLGLG